MQTATVNVLYVAAVCCKLCHPPEGRDSIHCSDVMQVRVRKEVGQEREGRRGEGWNVAAVTAFSLSELGACNS